MGQAVFVLAVIVLVLIFSSLRVCSEWQRKVVLRLGRFAGVRGPGLFFLLPFVERTPFTIDLRTVTSSFTAEQTLTRDNVPVNVDTILFWRVIDPARAVLEVANYAAAVQGAAQTALRDVIGRSDLSQVLSERTALDAAMTQRERQARMVLGDSEVQVAQRFADAGKLYDENPMALHLRGMNMLYEVMKTGGTATVIVPSTAVESMSFGGISGVTALAREAAQSVGDGGRSTPPAPPPVASPPPPFGIPGPPTGSS